MIIHLLFKVSNNEDQIILFSEQIEKDIVTQNIDELLEELIIQFFPDHIDYSPTFLKSLGKN